ncbi:MAG: hypothetical protein N3A71_03165 [Candidatus Dojkabacteria bacterium]|nr:hypothetical protein [Candidatus Dojkabacteria bacterium]
MPKIMYDKFFLIELLGVLGAIMILGAYFLLSINYLSADNLFYQLLNILGSLVLLCYSFYKKAWANVGINFIWMIIGLFALVSIIF